MSQEPNTFQTQLLLFLQEDIKKKKDEEGWDDRTDAMMRELSDAISQSIRSSMPMPLDQIIDQYRYLFQDRGPLHLEQKILSSFPQREMASLGFKPLCIYRGLPRLYFKNQPQISKLKWNFSHLPSLKRSTALKTLYSLYRQVPVPADGKIAILDERDDDEAVGVAKLIQNAFPSLEILLAVMNNKKMPAFNGHLFRLSDADSIEILSQCDLLLQLSAIDSHAAEVRVQIEELCKNAVLPKWEQLGHYGSLELDRFHPRTRAHSMGLHFLERGILTYAADSNATISYLENEQLAQWLFNQMPPSQEEIHQYRQKHRFFLADLLSDPGIFVYLHALFKSLENDPKDIDLCIPHPVAILAFFANRQNKDPFEKYQIQQIVFHIGSLLSVWNLGSTGKTIRILSPSTLGSADLQRLTGFSEEFVATNSDSSLSRVISFNKSFFFDSPEHSRYFLKDLIALAQNRIAHYPSSVEVLRLYAKVLEHHLPEEGGDWVDEVSIQSQKMDLFQIAETIGLHLQNPKTFAGFKQLNRIIVEDYSCNDFILNCVKRSFCHRCDPEVERIEEEEFTHFVHGRQSFSSLVQSLRGVVLLRHANR